MTDHAEIEAKFWKALKSDMTFMIGLAGHDDPQPMTAMIEREGPGPIYIFSAKDVDLVRKTATGARAVATFTAKGHTLFAGIEGDLVPDNDRATIDRLWNSHIAAWYPGGKDDPNLQLLRFDAEQAQIWLNETSLLAGIKSFFGQDPKPDYKDKTATVNLAS